MNDLDKRIRTRVESFVEDLSELLRLATAEAVAGALDDEIKSALRRATSGGGGGKRDKSERGGGEKARGRVREPPARKKGQKRPPEEIAKLTEDLYAHIAAHPGQNVEEISKSLGQPTSALTLPLTKLFNEKRIKKKGIKRATRYSPKVPRESGGKGKSEEETAAE